MNEDCQNLSLFFLVFWLSWWLTLSLFFLLIFFQNGIKLLKREKISIFSFYFFYLSLYIKNVEKKIKCKKKHQVFALKRRERSKRGYETLINSPTLFILRKTYSDLPDNSFPRERFPSKCYLDFPCFRIACVPVLERK